MTTLPGRIVTDALGQGDALLNALAVCHRASRPQLPDRLVALIAGAHRLQELSVEAGAAHRAAEAHNRLREAVDGLKAAAVAGRTITLDDAAGVAQRDATIADLRSRVTVCTTASGEAARDALAACNPSTLAPILEQALEVILDEAEQPAAIMAGARGFDWSDPAAVHRQPAAIQAAFAALVPLADHRGHVLAAVVALAIVRRDWRPEVPGVGTVPPGRPGVTETGHPVLRLMQAVSARNAATDPTED